MSSRTPISTAMLSLAIAGILMAPSALQAGSIYKCVDLDGFTSYSSQPCGELDLTDEVIREPEWPAGQAPRIPYSGQVPGIPGLGEARPLPEESGPDEGRSQPAPNTESVLGPST